MTTGIVGAGSYILEQVVANGGLTKIMETNDEWICSRTGMGTRRIATNRGTSYMAAKASTDTLENAGVKPDEIDLMLLATPSPDYCFPNGTCEVWDRIGVINAACFDINAARTGFVYTLNIAHAFMGSGVYKATLVIGTGVLGKLTDQTDQGTCVLSGDGTGAAVVKADETGILGMNIHSDGTKGGVLTCGFRTNGNFLLDEKPELGCMIVNDQGVFKFAVRKIPQRITEVLEDIGVKVKDVRYFAIHQVNYRIIKFITKRLKVNVDRFPVNMKYYGNTSGVSAPILSDELNRKGTLSVGDKMVLSGFGAGLIWGVVLLEQ